MRKLFTENEITLCTYAAMYDADDFGGIDAIYYLEFRSTDSIKMKIMNIASMLDEESITRYNYQTIKPLTGLTTGEKGRRTNWDIVKKLYPLDKDKFLELCLSII